MRIAVVYRNLERKNRGYIVIGTSEGENVEWSAPIRFSEKTEAYDPVVAGFDGDNKIIVAWRDRQEKGKCWSRAGLVGGVPESRDHITWSEAKNFCGTTKDQHSERFQAVALNSGKFVLLYGDGTLEANNRYGAAYLGEVTVQEPTTGVLLQVGMEDAGLYRFAEQAVSRLSVSRLTPTQFVVGYSAEKGMSEKDPSKFHFVWLKSFVQFIHYVDYEITLQKPALTLLLLITYLFIPAVPEFREVSLAYGEFVEDNLVFDPHHLALEPAGESNIW